MTTAGVGPETTAVIFAQGPALEQHLPRLLNTNTLEGAVQQTLLVGSHFFHGTQGCPDHPPILPARLSKFPCGRRSKPADLLFKDLVAKWILLFDRSQRFADIQRFRHLNPSTYSRKGVLNISRPRDCLIDFLPGEGAFGRIDHGGLTLIDQKNPLGGIVKNGFLFGLPAVVVDEDIPQGW